MDVLLLELRGAPGAREVVVDALRGHAPHVVGLAAEADLFDRALLERVYDLGGTVKLSERHAPFGLAWIGLEPPRDVRRPAPWAPWLGARIGGLGVVIAGSQADAAPAAFRSAPRLLLALADRGEVPRGLWRVPGGVGGLAAFAEEGLEVHVEEAEARSLRLALPALGATPRPPGVLP